MFDTNSDKLKVDQKIFGGNGKKWVCSLRKWTKIGPKIRFFEFIEEFGH